jgi:hypothetical protein
MIDMSDVVACHNNTLIDIEQAGTITRTDGFVSEGAPTTLTNQPATYHPTTGEDLESLPEEDRQNESLTFYTTVQIQTAELKSDRRPDVILWNNNRYRAVTVPKWFVAGKYYATIAVRED